MRRVGKGFSGLDTPLFEGMLAPQVKGDIVGSDDVANVDDVAADAEPTLPLPTPVITPPPPQKEVESLEQDKIAQALEITKLKQRVRRLEQKRKLKASGLRRLKKDDEAEPAELIEVIEVVTTAKLMTEVVTIAATTITAAPSAARRRKGVVIKDPGEDLEEKASKAIKRKSESSEEKAAKKQKLDEELEELKTHLQIVPNDEDDEYTEATPLALKVPVVDYQIHTEHNKPYFKIIRANETHQLFLSFISLLRNFDTEDLEM
nr:hypothetical protein [Tanacetum cinerariifolium]